MSGRFRSFIVLSFAVSGTVLGQADDLGINRSLQDFALDMRFGGNEAGRKVRSNIEGSEFLDENFVNGEILTRNSEHFTGIPMRYNAFLDNVEVKLPNGTIHSLTDPEIIFQILLNKQVLVYENYMSGSGKKSGFLFMLHDGKSKLYRRYYKVFNEGRPSNGITPEIPPKIADKPTEIYVRVGEGMPGLCNSKKDLLAMMGSDAKAMDNFLKKEKIRMNSEEDLIKALSHYDTLH